MTGSTEFDLSVPATPDSIALVRHAVRAALEDHEAPPAVTADVLLAVSEACTNAVVHAYPDGTAGPERDAAEVQADKGCDDS